MSICYRFTSEHFQFWMLHISVNSSLPVKFQFLRQLQLLLHSSSDGVNFDLLCQNPSWVDRHRVTAVALMQHSSSRGWHRIQTAIIVISQKSYSGAVLQMRSNFYICPLVYQLLSLPKDKEIIGNIYLNTDAEWCSCRSFYVNRRLKQSRRDQLVDSG